jgi:hypothetical protein
MTRRKLRRHGAARKAACSAGNVAKLRATYGSAAIQQPAERLHQHVAAEGSHAMTIATPRRGEPVPLRIRPVRTGGARVSCVR